MRICPYLSVYAYKHAYARGSRLYTLIHVCSRASVSCPRFTLIHACSRLFMRICPYLSDTPTNMHMPVKAQAEHRQNTGNVQAEHGQSTVTEQAEHRQSTGRTQVQQRHCTSRAQVQRVGCGARRLEFSGAALGVWGAAGNQARDGIPPLHLECRNVSVPLKSR